MLGRGVAQRLACRALFLPALASALSGVSLYAGDTAVLFDQTALSSSGSVAAQHFESARFERDCEAADDFTVLGPDPWLVESVALKGTYSSPATSVTGVAVWFRTDQGGSPGSVICSVTGTVVQDTDGDLFVDLGTPCALNPGVIWMSVAAELDFTGRGRSSPGQWFWDWSAEPSGSPAMWRNPSGGFPTYCTGWGTLPDCLGYEARSLRFALIGEVLGDRVFSDGFESGDVSAWSGWTR